MHDYCHFDRDRTKCGGKVLQYVQRTNKTKQETADCSVWLH